MLDPVIVIRDVTFYALSLILLFNAFLNQRPLDGSEEEYIFISNFDSALLLGCYIFYVIVCGNFDRILYFLQISSTKKTKDDSYEVFDEKLVGEVSLNMSFVFTRKISAQSSFQFRLRDVSRSLLEAFRLTCHLSDHGEKRNHLKICID